MSSVQTSAAGVQVGTRLGELLGGTKLPRILGVGGEIVVWGNPPVRCSLARTGGDGTVRSMRELLILAIHLLVTLAKLVRPRGVCAVAAESLMLKHQLFISNRSRQRAPNLTTLDRLVGPWTNVCARANACLRLAHAFGAN